MNFLASSAVQAENIEDISYNIYLLIDFFIASCFISVDVVNFLLVQSELNCFISSHFR